MKIKCIQAKEKNFIELVAEELQEPGEGEIQIQAEMSVVSPGTERAFISSLPNTYGDYPRKLGYSCSGTVTKIGKGVSSFKPQDRVAAIMRHQSAANVIERHVVHIPDGVSAEQAAYVRIGVITLQAVRKARIELGESCLILGQGLIGQNAAQLARVSGAYPVICVDTVKSKLDLAQKNGADAAIDANSPDWVQQVLAVTGGKGAKIVLESTGFSAPINDAFAVAAKYGRVILLASSRGNTEVNFYRDVHKKGLYVIGAHIDCNPEFESRRGHWTFKDDAQAYLNMLKSNRVTVADLKSECRSYREYQEIYTHVLGWEKDYITSIIDWREND
jgi:NADPH:quinone reductase-like Zn-dependent oxidoreductase